MNQQITLHEALTFLNHFINIPIIEKYHVADGIHFIVFNEDQEIYIDGDWFCTSSGRLLNTNFLLAADEDRPHFMRRLEDFIDNISLNRISSIDLSISALGIPILIINFDRNTTLTLIGNQEYQTFPRFKLKKETLDYDYDKKCFIIEKATLK